MKRSLMLLLLALWAIPQVWAVSANLTTNGSSCPAATNTTAIVVGLAEDKGGATLTVAGTWTGTISFYGTGSGSINNGGIWTALSVVPLGSSTAVTSTTANGTWQVNVAGFTGICMLSSASMTGTATVTVTPSAASAKSNGSGGGGSGIQSINSDTTSAQVIQGASGTGVVTSAGTTTITPGKSFACSGVSAGSPPWGVCTATVSSAQLLLMGAGTTHPVTLISAQGSGTVIDVTKITEEFVCNSCTPYTVASGSFEFYYGSTDAGANLIATGFIDQSTSQILGTPAVFSLGTTYVASTITNQALTINSFATPGWTLGTGTLKLTIEYTITGIS